VIEMKEEVYLAIITAAIVIFTGIYVVRTAEGELAAYCLKTNETVRTKFGEIDCYQYNIGNITAYMVKVNLLEDPFPDFILLVFAIACCVMFYLALRGEKNSGK